MGSTRNRNSFIEDAYNIVRYHVDASVILVALFPTVYAFRGGDVYSIFIGVFIAGMVLALFIVAIVMAASKSVEIIKGDIDRVASSSTLLRNALVTAYSIMYAASLIYVVLRIVVPAYIYIVFYTLIAGGDSTSSLESGVSILSVLIPLLFILLSAVPISFRLILHGIERNIRAVGR